MTASICFITCGLHAHIAEALRALFEHTPQNTEIVIYENNTKLPFRIDRNNFILFGHWTGEFDGIAKTRNRCIDKSTGDVIIWIDDDIIVCPGYIDAFTKPFELDNKAGIVGYDACKLIGGENFIDLCHVNPFEVTPDYFDSPYAVRRAMINEIGNYDESLGKYDCDNTDLCLRAYQNRWKLHPIQNPGITHWMGSTRDVLKQTDVKRVEWRKSFERMNEKHHLGWRKRYGIDDGRGFMKDEKIQYRPGELR